MKDILFIGGPKTVQGVDRIDDDVVSILGAEGVFDRKAVVVWPTEDFMDLPSDPAKLLPLVDMADVEVTAMSEKDMIPMKGITVAEAEPLRVIVREDQEAMDKALITASLSRAFARLSKLILAVSGGQNLVLVISQATPKHACLWAGFLQGWTLSEGKEVQSYTSSDSGYGVLNSIKNWPLVFHGAEEGTMKAGLLVPHGKHTHEGHNVYFGQNSYAGTDPAHDIELTTSFPVTDRFSTARAIKVSNDKGYMLVIPPPAKLKNFIIGLKTGGTHKTVAAKPRKAAVDTEYLTRKETAELLKMTERTVDRRIEDGKLKSTKIEGKVLILKSSVDALLQ